MIISAEDLFGPRYREVPDPLGLIIGPVEALRIPQCAVHQPIEGRRQVLACVDDRSVEKRTPVLRVFLQICAAVTEGITRLKSLRAPIVNKPSAPDRCGFPVESGLLRLAPGMPDRELLPGRRSAVGELTIPLLDERPDYLIKRLRVKHKGDVPVGVARVHKRAEGLPSNASRHHIGIDSRPAVRSGRSPLGNLQR